MPYTRAKAVGFADTHWNTPADDGLFWLSNEAVVIEQVRKANVVPTSAWKKAPAAEGWQPVFVDDGKGGEKAVFRRVVGGITEEILINPWEGIADCAHFLSRCLTAGGLNISERGVPSLVQTLKGLHNTKVLCEQVDKDGGQRVIDNGLLKPGDMIGYFNVDPKGDYGGARQYSHSGMFVGKINGSKDGAITCHTICRFPGRSWVEDSWWLKPPGHYAYTFIHFTDDDPVPDRGKVDALAGWWQLEHLGKTEFYLVRRDGTAQYTLSKPKKGQLVAPHAPNSAHWFMGSAGDVTFVWRKAGTIEVWTPDGGGFKSTINKVIPRVLTKLF